MDITMMFVVSLLEGRPVLLLAILYQMFVGVMLLHTATYINSLRNWIIKLICQPSCLVLCATILITWSRYTQMRTRRQMSLRDFPDKSFVYAEPRYSLAFPSNAIQAAEKSQQENQDERRGRPNEFLMDIPSYEHTDSTVKTYLKFLINFFFYRFGLEVIISALILIASMRVDWIALLYILMACLCIFTKRRNLAKMWKLPMLNTSFIICLEYIYWMGIPTFGRPPRGAKALKHLNKSKIFVDAICLILITIQKRIFNSQLFQLVVEDLRAASQLTTMGAKIYNELIAKRLAAHYEIEQLKFKEISKRLQQIKDEQGDASLQLKLHGGHRKIEKNEMIAFVEKSNTSHPSPTDEASLKRISIFSVSSWTDLSPDSSDYLSALNDYKETHFQEIFKVLTTDHSHNFYSSPIMRHLQFLYRSIATMTISYLREESLVLLKIDEDLAAEKRRIKNLKLQKVATLPGRSSTVLKNSLLHEILQCFYFYFATYSAEICYVLMTLCHTISGSVLSLPLPFLAFLWGMLSIPRPPTIFWTIVIGYTQAAILLKYIIKFVFSHWGIMSTVLMDTAPMSLATLLDLKLSKRSGQTSMWQLSQFMDIILLITLFFHKSTLQRFYLWGTNKCNEKKGNSQNIPRQGFSATFKNQINNCLRNHLPASDYYSQMFYFDLIGMIIVIMFYNSFGESSRTDVVQALKENKVPTAFLVLIFVQFIFILIDRAIYLTRNRLMKLIFLIVQVIIVHLWLFFVLPIMKKRGFVRNQAAQLWYLVKCAYFAISAKQFKSGYPTSTTGSVFSQSYDRLNKYLYKLLLAVPFMFEIRSLMGWIWTDTCLNLSNWILVEDIYSHIFILKCERDIEKLHEQSHSKQSSNKIAKMEKLKNGGLSFIIIITIIWFPLMLFSFSSSFYQANPPTVVDINMQFVPYPVSSFTPSKWIAFIIFMSNFQSIFNFHIENSSIRSLTKREYSQLGQYYIFEKQASEFLRDFRRLDISKVQVSMDSVLQWPISPIGIKGLIDDLRNHSLVHRFKCDIYRHQQDDDGVFPAWRKVTLQRVIEINDGQLIKSLRIMLLSSNQTGNQNITLMNAIPKFIYMKGNSEATEIEPLRKVGRYYINLTYILHRRKDIYFWQVYDKSLRDPSTNEGVSEKNPDHRSFEFYIFTDRISPDSISFITKYG
ncbi:hypothetical protein ACOME3_009511 [Neoechinorhynchus agilis]